MIHGVSFRIFKIDMDHNIVIVDGDGGHTESKGDCHLQNHGRINLVELMHSLDDDVGETGGLERVVGDHVTSRVFRVFH